MADLSSLLQMSPGVGGFMMGQQQASQLATDEQRRQELAQLVQIRMQEAQQKADMAPLMMEHQRLQNSGLSAGLGGIAATSKQKGLEAAMAEKTFDSDVAAKTAKNEKTVDDTAFARHQHAQQVMLEAGPMLESVPPPMRAMAFREHLRGAGLNPDSPQLARMLALAQSNPQAFPAQVSKLAEALGAQAEAMNPAARSAKAVAGINRASAEKIAAGHDATSLRVAEIGAQAKRDVQAAKGGAADVWSNLISGKMTSDKAFVAAAAGKLKAKTDEEKAVWDELGRMVEQFTYNKPQARDQGAPTLDNGKLTNKPPVPGVFGNGKPKGTGTKDDPIVLD